MRSAFFRFVPCAVLLLLLFSTFSFVILRGGVSAFDRDAAAAPSLPAGTASADTIPVLLQEVTGADGLDSSPATQPAIRVRLRQGVFTGTGEQRFRVWLGAERGYRIVRAGAAANDVLGTRTSAVTVDENGFGALMLTADGELFGSIWFGDTVYEIGPAGEGDLHQVRRMAPEEVDAVDHLAVPASAGAGYEDSVDVAPATASRVIDVLALATPQFCEEIGRRSAGRLDETAEIAGLVAATNATLARSGAAVRLRLVGVDEVSAADDGAGDDLLLEALCNGADRFAGVARQRAALGADLVILFLPGREGAAGSTAYRPMNFADLDPENGFAIVRCGESRFANELSLARAFGSLMGLAGGAVSDDTPARRPFLRGAWGHYFGPSVRYPFGSAGERGTVMTSARAVVPFYSNPQRILSGTPLGKWNGQRTDADAVRALNIAAARVSRYQEMAKNTPPESLTWTVGEYNISEFTFKDLQGFDDFSRIHIEFSHRKLDRVMEFTYSPKTDIWVLNIKNEGVVKGDLLHNIQGGQIGGSFGYILLNPLLESSLVKHPRKLGFRMNIKLEVDQAISYRVRTKAYDNHGTTRGWKTMGKIFSGKSTSSSRMVKPSADETLVPKIQLLENAGKIFLAGPDIYAGMYNYPNSTGGTDRSLTYWVGRAAESDLNYIRLIVQANVWTTNQNWRDDLGGGVYKIRPERSIFTQNGSGLYTLAINENSPSWTSFEAGLSEAASSEVKLHIDLSDAIWSKTDWRFEQSEYYANYNTLSHVQAETDYGSAIPLAWLHDDDTGIGSFGSYSTTNANFEKMIRGEQDTGATQSMTEAIVSAVVAESGN